MDAWRDYPDGARRRARRQDTGDGRGACGAAWDAPPGDTRDAQFRDAFLDVGASGVQPVGRPAIWSWSGAKKRDASCALCARQRSSMFAVVAGPPAAKGCTW